MESIKSLLSSKEAECEVGGQTDRPKEFSCPSIVAYTETDSGDTEVIFSNKKYMKDLDDLQTELFKLKLRTENKDKEWDIVSEFIGPELALFSKECEVLAYKYRVLQGVPPKIGICISGLFWKSKKFKG